MTDGATPAAVEIAQVARRFGRRWALRGVSLGVQPGEVVALAGHNGSGKTTLLRVISTALRPTKGTGQVYGHDIVREADVVRGLVGVMGHDTGNYGDLTARENLEFSLRMTGHRPDADAVRAALKDVGLSREANERARTFSSGMMRRLSLARLILQPPRLLLLDEPYASFDVEGIERVNAFVRSVAGSGGTVIVATHDLDRASAVMGRVVQLSKGRIVADEPYDAGSRPAEARNAALGAGVD